MSTIIETQQGKLQGKTLKNLDGKPIYGFHGIPFAKPPLGSLRFKDPQEPEAWSGIKDASIEASECISRDMIFQNLVGSEDCLYLNVYTREITKPKPVMVWIHGGAFKSGSSKTDMYGPEYLLTEDIVLVTINYRLGIFGFLSLEDSKLDIPGNAGLKDMILALKWVQNNIRNFGGDSSNVTIFGESAGAASVHYLVLSPLAKNLFHKAIIQSGSALNDFALGHNNINTYLAQTLNLGSNNETKFLEHLQKLTAEELFDVYEKTVQLCEETQTLMGRLPFAPVIEKSSPTAFIAEEPLQIIKSGNYNKVPMIFGFTTTEGMLIEVKIRPRKPTAPKNFEILVPYKLGVKPGCETSQLIARRIQEFYYGDVGSEDKLENFYKLHTDNVFVRDIYFSVLAHSLNNQPIYLYRMSIETKLNLFKKIFKIKTPGVCHADDLGYLFKTKISPPLTPGSLEELSVRRFVKYWTNFARYGNPNPGVNSTDPEWKPVVKDALNFIDIGEQIIAGVNPDSERMEFWKEIYRCNPLYTI